MAQFTCPVCGEEFEQQSRFNRHIQTSHPQKAPTTADVMQMLKGVQFPKTREELIIYAQQKDDKSKTIALLEDIPKEVYKDAAEVTRAISSVKRHERKPAHQPSKLGGEHAASSPKSPSAAQIASMLSGITFPKNAKQLQDYARSQSKEKLDSEAAAKVTALLQHLPAKKYVDMSEVTKGIHEAKKALEEK